jgi:hypothetical protein
MQGDIMSKVLAYKGFDVDIGLLPLQGGQYQPQIHITRQQGDSVNTRTFTGADYFALDQEAIQYGFHVAREIIDGKVQGCSVDDMTGR